MANDYTKPNEITTVGTGDGKESSQYNSYFGLVTADGSGNPPIGADTTARMSHYNKDLDLVQNMRNLFYLVSSFKDAVDNILATSEYGGWTVMTSYIHPDDRIKGIMYLKVLVAYNDKEGNYRDPEGNLIPIWKIQVENYTGAILKFNSDADITYYENSTSYYLTSINVNDALDELSHRSIIKRATIPASGWTLVAANDTTKNGTGEEYYYNEVEVPGMLESDYPVATLQPSHTRGVTIQEAMASTIDANQLLAVGHIARIQTLNNKIRAYCYDGYRPTVDIPMIFRVLRGGEQDI